MLYNGGYHSYGYVVTNLNMRELVQKMVMHGQLDRYLYKYRSLSEGSEKNTIKIINNCELWFSSPASFNDPFDCSITPMMSSRERGARLLAKRQLRYAPKAVEDAAKNDPEFIEKAKQASLRVAERQGICCLSKTNDNILMWTHYADCHKGICLEFDVLEDPDFFCFPINVEYRTNYPEVDFSKEDFNEEVMKIYKTKYSDWAYEKEVRICKVNGGDKPYAFNPSALRNIYFGCKSDENIIGKIREAVASNKDLGHVKFFKGVTNESSYRIDFKQI